MSHPYQACEDTPHWKALDAELRALEENRDLTITTARVYVIGSLRQELVARGLVAAASRDGPAV